MSCANIQRATSHIFALIGTGTNRTQQNEFFIEWEKHMSWIASIVDNVDSKRAQASVCVTLDCRYWRWEQLDVAIAWSSNDNHAFVEKANTICSQYNASNDGNDHVQRSPMDDTNTSLQIFFQHLEQLLEIDLKRKTRSIRWLGERGKP